MTARITLPHEYATIDPAVRRELVQYAAVDGYPLTGILHRPARTDPPVALLAMHPRGDFTRHYLAPWLLEGGYAFFGAVTRHLNHDADALHERLLLDVAGAVAWLREAGFAQVILLGNSGGGSLFAFYIAQQGLAPAARLAHAPSGDASGLPGADLPAVDGFILLAAHLGEGQFLLDRLDPSVVDEGDPAAVNPRLDMYDPANGYRPMREGPSRYSPEFLAAFRAGQRARCERLDRQALAWCEEAAFFRRRMSASDEGCEAGERGGAHARGTPCAAAALHAHLPHARRSAVSRSLARPLGACARIDLLLRPRSDRRQLRRGAGAGDERARLALDVVGPFVERRARAHVAVRLAADSRDQRARGYRHPSRGGAPCLRRGGVLRQVHHELPGADHYLRPTASDGCDPRERAGREIVVPWLRARWPA